MITRRKTIKIISSGKSGVSNAIPNESNEGKNWL